MEPKLLWRPSAERAEGATIARFARAVGREGDYDALWRWSVDDLEGFWGAIWEFFDVQASEPYERVLGRREMPGARVVPGVAAVLRRALLPRPRRRRGRHPPRRRAARAVAVDLGRAARADRRASPPACGRSGVGPGDRVAAYMPNIPETIAAFLATASIGAVWSSAAPEFGARSVVDRFAQIEPKVLLAVDGYRYGGRDHDRSEAVAGIAGEIGAQVVRFGYLDGSGWPEELVARDEPLSFEQRPVRPSAVAALQLGHDRACPSRSSTARAGSCSSTSSRCTCTSTPRRATGVFWFTTTGWMMWNFLVGVLLTPASIVLYDGNPGTPDLGALWDLAERTGMTTFGTSASYIASCMKAGVEPREGRDLSALRAVGSTGSPLSPEGFDWVYDHVGSDTWLFSTSGGTDLCTAFVGGVPTLPVYEGELQARALGAKVEAFDEDGDALVGQVGELVLTEPMPSMPISFWGDDDGSRLRESYFSMYPGIWRHGDWIEITERGTAIIYGRSDSTINRGGIRMGTSEIYRAVLADDDVVDALVVDVPREGTDGWMPLFVVLREGATLDDDLVARIKRRIREDCSPRHVPNEIHRIAEVPRTLSGKALEVPGQADPHGRPGRQGRQPRVAGQPRRAGLLRRAGRRRLTQARVDRPRRRPRRDRAARRAGRRARAPAARPRAGRARAGAGRRSRAPISASVGCALRHHGRAAGSSHSRTVVSGARRSARRRARSPSSPAPTKTTSAHGASLAVAMAASAAAVSDSATGATTASRKPAAAASATAAGTSWATPTSVPSAPATRAPASATVSASAPCSHSSAAGTRPRTAVRGRSTAARTTSATSRGSRAGATTSWVARARPSGRRPRPWAAERASAAAATISPASGWSTLSTAPTTPATAHSACHTGQPGRTQRASMRGERRARRSRRTSASAARRSASVQARGPRSMAAGH